MVKTNKTEKSRLGETLINNQGEEMEIVEYNNSHDITIQFKSTKEVAETTYGAFKTGEVKSHFSPTIYDVGIKGIAPTTDENGKKLGSYMCWYDMLRRCYSKKCQEKHPTYIGCTVSEEFKNYDSFKLFYDKNYYEIKELGKIQLDKDVLYKNNEIYSKENCIFVPQIINKLFTKRQNYRGDLPIGVSLNGKNYQAQCNDGDGKLKYLGAYTTPELAFNSYKKFKEKYIKQIAEAYKSRLPTKLYEAMYYYTVEITD